MNHEHLGGIFPGFAFAGLHISTYSLMVTLALIVAITLYIHNAKQYGKKDETALLIAAGAIIGSAIGSKLLEMIININLIDDTKSLAAFLLSGRTVVGGIIGGAIGVKLIKYISGKKERRGNILAPAVAAGISVGRVGCFLSGCCYGKPTSLPWGVDFGDGIYRHPTQLYESLYMLGVCILLQTLLRRKEYEPGYLFQLFLMFYFVFRFLTEFIRTEKMAIAGLTYFQFISIFCILYSIFSNHGLILKKIMLYEKK